MIHTLPLNELKLKLKRMFFVPQHKYLLSCDHK